VFNPEKTINFIVTNNKKARHWEKRLHRMLWRNRKKGEWFELDSLPYYLTMCDELFNGSDISQF
jgi:hypothetical protein